MTVVRPLKGCLDAGVDRRSATPPAWHNWPLRSPHPATKLSSAGLTGRPEPGDDAGPGLVGPGQRVPGQAGAVGIQPVIPSPRTTLLARIDLLPRAVQPAEGL